MGSALFDTASLDHAGAEARYGDDALRMQVAERLAAHRGRRLRQRPEKTAAAADSDQSFAPTVGTARSRVAAAVAERYANSPSYRAFLAAEAERAIAEAQAAAEVAALNAKAVAQAQYELLDSLYPEPRTGASSRGPDQRLEPMEDARLQPLEELTLSSLPAAAPIKTASRASAAKPRKDGLSPRREPDERQELPWQAAQTPKANPPAAGLTVRFDRSIAIARPHAAAQHAARYDDLSELEALALDREIEFRHAPVFEEPAGPPTPLPANLIQFPRQLVAPRKARPRYAEGPLREEGAPAAGGSQLRIFEVDPGEISTTPAPEDPTAQWTSIWLEAPPAAEICGAQPGEPSPDLPPAATDPTEAYLGRLAPPPRPVSAALSRRMMAWAMDGGAIGAACVAFACAFAKISLSAPLASEGAQFPWTLASLLARARPLAALTTVPPAAALAACAACFGFFYLLYQALFFTFSDATPGMRIARIALCTFEDENPTRRAMRCRILAILISASPLGLGLLWSLLDEDRLGWHDRMSRMYQRSY